MATFVLVHGSGCGGWVRQKLARYTPDLFAAFAEKARAAGWQTHELAAGHLAMLTAPREVAELLLELAAARG